MLTPVPLRVNEVVLARNGRRLNRALSFTLAAGEAMHVQGRNGSGKTTLLDTLATLASPASGSVFWQGRAASAWGDEVRALWHYCGHVDALKGEWTLLENLRWQARLLGQTLDASRLEAALQDMALTALVAVSVAQFSKGQQRRAALLRLRLFERPVWLLDEPFSALDQEGALALVAWINQHLDQGGMALFTTHQAYPPLARAPTALLLAGGR